MHPFQAHIKEKLNPFPVLETERLVLRDFRDEDFDALLKMRSDERVRQFTGRGNNVDADSITQMLERMRSSREKGEAIGWAGQRKGMAQDGFIGACGFNRIDFDNHRAEIGGEMDTAGWGKFFSFEAVKAILEFGQQVLQFHTIEAKIVAGNRNAIYLVEKLGFEKEAHFRDYIHSNGQYKDMTVYTLHTQKLV